MAVKLPKLDSVTSMTTEVETAILNLSMAMKAIKNGNLKEEAVVILLQAQTGINRTTIKQVLMGLSNMEKMYLKEPQP